MVRRGDRLSFLAGCYYRTFTLRHRMFELWFQQIGHRVIPPNRVQPSNGLTFEEVFLRRAGLPITVTTSKYANRTCELSPFNVG
ncbi:hypothetical protein NL676_011955 [Syzygium grande]|nr:hypothetical protein NL676_011955 [Syzygium grande]